MARTVHPVFRALKRWEGKGLLDPDLVGVLAAEVEAEARTEGRRWSQYLLAATGAAVLIVAGGTFLAWAWPEMGPAGQSVTLAVLGFGVIGLGMRMPKRGRWVAVSFLLQIAGSVLILMALIHSERAWSDGSVGGWAVGLLGLVLPVGLFLASLREDGILAGLQAALGFAFLYVFLDRALGLGEEPILWILDGVMVLGLAILAFRLLNPGVPRWVLSVFFALLFSSVVLIVFSADVLWNLDAETIFPMDFWLLMVAGIALFGLQEGAPAHLRRDWYEPLLALCVLVAIPFAFITTLESLNTGPTPAALTVAAVGGLGLWFSLPRGSKSVLVASCIALLIAAWYWGAEMSGALGAVLALVVVSAVFFWGSTRMGGGPEEEGPGEERPDQGEAPVG